MNDDGGFFRRETKDWIPSADDSQDDEEDQEDEWEAEAENACLNTRSWDRD